MGGNATVIDIVAQVTDETEAGARSAEKNLSKLEKSMKSIQQRITDMKGKSKFEIAVGIRDMASAGLCKIAGAGKKLASKAWTVTMKLKDLVTAPFRGIAKMLANPIVQIATITGVSLGVKDTIDTYKSFQQGMANVKAISNATDEDFAKLTATAKELGETTMFSASQAAEAMENLAMAGWKAKDIISGMPGLLDLAAAGSVDLATASDVVSSALAQFKMDAGESSRVADVLAAVATNSKTDVAGLGDSLKYAGTMAGSLGYTIEDTALALGLMGNAGVDASSAGSSVRMMFARMSKQEGLTAEESNAVANAMKKVGVSLTDEKGKMKSMYQVIVDLRKGFAKLDDAEKAATASNLAGTYSMTGLLAIVNASDEKFNKLAKAIENSKDAASRMADIKMDTLQGSMYYLQSAAEGLKIEIGDKLEPYLRGFIDWLTSKMPAIKVVALEAMDTLGEKIEDVQKKIERMTQSNEWKGAITLWDKIKVAWNKIIAEPFDDWWNSTGRAWLTEKAGNVGQFMGNFLKTGLLTLLGVDVGDVLTEGAAVGKAFMDGFLEGFEPSKVLEGIKNAIGAIFKDAGTNSNTSDLSRALVTISALKVGSMGLSAVQGGATIAKGVKGIAGAIKGVSAAGAGAASAAGTAGAAGLANVAGTAVTGGLMPAVGAGASSAAGATLASGAAAATGGLMPAVGAGAAAATGGLMPAVGAGAAATGAAATGAAGTAGAAGAAGVAGAAGAAGAGVGATILGALGAGAAVGLPLIAATVGLYKNTERLNDAAKEFVNETLFGNGLPKLTEYTAALKADNAETYRLASQINKTSSELETIKGKMQDAALSVQFFGTSLREDGTLSPTEAQNMITPFNDLCEALEKDFSVRYNNVFEAFKKAAGDVATTLGADVATISATLDKFKEKYTGIVEDSQTKVNGYLEKQASGETLSESELADLQKQLEAISAYAGATKSQSQFDYEQMRGRIGKMDLGKDQEQAISALQELSSYSSAYIEELTTAMNQVNLDYENLRGIAKTSLNLGNIDQSEYDEFIKTLNMAQAITYGSYSEKISAQQSDMNSVRDALLSQIDQTIKAGVSEKLNDPISWFSLEALAGVFGGGDTTYWAFYNSIQEQYKDLIDSINSLPQTVGTPKITIPIDVETVYRDMLQNGGASSSVAPHANGGIMTRPHIGLVAEDGAEAIIPLSGKRRERGLELWQETGRMLGVREYAEGGIVGTVPPISSGAGSGGMQITVELGGIEIGGFHIEVDGSASPDEIIDVIRANITNLSDEIANELAEKLQAVFTNMPLKATE